MEVYRCNRQALKQCWQGEEEGGSGEMLTAKAQGFVWLLTAFLPDVQLSEQRHASVLAGP